MAITQAHQDFVVHSAASAQRLLDMYGLLVQLDTLWAGSPGYNSAITQGELDSVASFSGLTTTQLGDAEFALAGIKNSITSAIVALTVMATAG